MGFRGGKNLQYGTVATFWKANEPKGKTIDANISIRKKNKDTDQYETDFSGYVKFCGEKMVEFVKRLKEKDKIEIESFDVTNKYDKEKKTTYTNISVFAAKPYEYSNSSNNSTSQKPNTEPADTSFMDIPEGADESLPFD